MRGDFMRSDLSERIKQYRINNNLTLDELAHMTGVSRATLARIENGQSNPTMKTIAAIEGTMIEGMVFDVHDLESYDKDTINSIVKFNTEMLARKGFTLNITDTYIDINSESGEGVSVTFSDLYDLYNYTVSSYFYELNKVYPFEALAEDTQD